MNGDATRDAAETDRAKGVLLGLAAGDRNGGPIEMATRMAGSLANEQRFDPTNQGLMRRVGITRPSGRRTQSSTG